MGINPNSGDGVEKNYTIDGRHDAENLVSDAEHTGQEAGKAFAHIAAQADSANTGNAELSKRVAALENASSPDLASYALKKDLDNLATKKDVQDSRIQRLVCSGTTQPGSARINIPLKAETPVPESFETSTVAVTVPPGVYRCELWLGAADYLAILGGPTAVPVTPANTSRAELNPSVVVKLAEKTSLYLRTLPTAGQSLMWLIEKL
ncbi:hypothetical protein [Corynebacterium kefirresidentii]|uniref:hypothetical protein n=1 Tax=Corynebacterium kefirresidentii TaxID=1979527 RepID=UPI000A362127|nr:hypothetical protein [Corynebacterium kefirresidentii]OUJ22322.1 hypothetical protein CBI45_09035 [Corynebacterium kefirresidentii]